jgi:hypothetical protein
MSMRRRFFTSVAVAMVVGAVATAGFAADMKMMAATQLKAAITEAGKTASATTLKSAQSHLQNLVNCLEGPGGGMFKKMEGAMMSACEGKGKGLLVDAKEMGGMSAGLLPWFEAANENAALGLKATTLARAQAAGYAAQSLLQRAEKSMMMKKM